jgi:hypothetical protein
MCQLLRVFQYRESQARRKVSRIKPGTGRLSGEQAMLARGQSAFGWREAGFAKKRRRSGEAANLGFGPGVAENAGNTSSS